MNRLKFHLFFWGCCLLVSCNKTTEQAYKAYEKQQLNSGAVNDSLFMGLYLGMSKKDFRTYCFDMNLKGKFKQGGKKNSSWVESKLKGLSTPAAINFYPNFKNDSISEMNAAIYYDLTEFNNEHQQKDSLLHFVLNIMDTWYGGRTFKIESPLSYKEDVYVKVHGNRRITIFPDPSNQLINLWYVDLTSWEGKKENR